MQAYQAANQFHKYSVLASNLLSPHGCCIFSLEECMLHEFTYASPDLLQGIDKNASSKVSAVPNISTYV